MLEIKDYLNLMYSHDYAASFGTEAVALQFDLQKFVLYLL